MADSARSSLPHIVVIGAGFGGLTFSQKFPTEHARVTVIDRQNHHLFQPLLYQVATAGLSAVDIAEPIRSILRKKENLSVLMTTVTRIDLDRRTVTHDHGELGYDYLVLAAGGANSYFGHPEWEQFAPGLKSLDDALAIRRSILSAYERAEAESDPARRAELMTTVVIGGGPTGVELAGTFAELARTALRRDFDHIDPAQAKVILLEYAPRILGTFPENLSESARQQLESLGVDVRTGEKVEDIRRNEVIVNGQSIRAENILWAAGVGGNPLAKLLPAETDRAGRLKVGPDLTLPGHPEVFAIGDIVSLKDARGKVVPAVAPAAMQMGGYVARVLAAEIQADVVPGLGAKREGFVYTDRGYMATIGRSRAVAKIGKLEFSGFPAWFAWLAVHLMFLVGFRSKLSVLFSWMYSYLTYKRGARVITGVGTVPSLEKAEELKAEG